MIAVAAADAEEAKVAPWSITADRITAQRPTQEISAEGQVVLEGPGTDGRGPLTVKADTLAFQQDSNVLEAHGHVSLREESSGLVRAESLRLNLTSRTGRLDYTTISLADQELNFTGRLAEKTGPDSYHFEQGIITSCPTSDDKAPAWSIHCGDARVTLDGMAILKNASLRVRGVPLLYTPFFMVPAKTTRQSGFLFPEYSQSGRDGVGFIIPLFVNISPSSDLTVYVGQYSQRGSLLSLEMRHLNAANSLLAIQADYLHDRTSDPGPVGGDDDYRHDGYLRDKHNRYWLRGKADHYFSDRLALRFDLDTASDRDYIHEYRAAMVGFEKNNQEFMQGFNRGLNEASLEYRESTLQLAGRSRFTSTGAELRYVNTPGPKPTGADPLQTLPRLTMHSRLPLLATPLSMAWDAEYLHYYRREGVGYQRLDLFPRLITPLPLGRFLEGALAGGVRETAYLIKTLGDPADGGWQGPHSPHRTAADFDANLATILSRDYNPGFSHLSSFNHLFRPSLGYRYFAPGDQLKLPELDGSDRLSESNQIYWQLNNYFMVEGHDRSSRAYANQIGHLKISQNFDLHENHRVSIGQTDQRHPFSDIALDLELIPLPATSLRYQTALNMYGDGVTAYQLQGSYRNSANDSLQFDYNYARSNANDLSLSLQLGISPRLATRYSTTLSFLADHKTSESATLLYTPQCWSMELTVSQDSNDRRLLLVFSLTGIGKALEIDQSGL
ncbi:MAG: LPS-assembly protein LptD [Desulfobulbaceae bacterium]|nr:LPS-assembly protein LptD [Desulfobulbaceae bacterium]